MKKIYTELVDVKFSKLKNGQQIYIGTEDGEAYFNITLVTVIERWFGFKRVRFNVVKNLLAFGNDVNEKVEIKKIKLGEMLVMILSQSDRAKSGKTSVTAGKISRIEIKK